MNTTAIIILAAGNSSRLGKPKQLLLFKGKTLIEHIIDEAQQITTDAVIVVTGADNEKITKEISNKNVVCVYNENWQEGMGSGIRKGMEMMLNSIQGKDVIICVCDQPFLSAAFLEKLIDEKLLTGKGIIASTYNDTLGTPVLFDKKYFNSLLTLDGKAGAKKLLSQYPADVVSIPFVKGDVDIDTEDDYRKLINTNT